VSLRDTFKNIAVLLKASIGCIALTRLVNAINLVENFYWYIF